MAYPLEKIEGIGPAYAVKLLVAGVKDTAVLLTRCRGPREVKALVEHAKTLERALEY